MPCSKIEISPGLITRWMNSPEKNENLILCDIEADNLNDHELRIDLNIVFNPQRIRRKGIVTREDFYIGSTGAEVAIEAKDGRVLAFTESAKIDVNYSNTNTITRKSSIVLAAKGASKDKNSSNAVESKMSLESGEQRNFVTSFSNSERILSTKDVYDTIEWALDLPRGESAVRDFIHGNLYLFARCHWPATPFHGAIKMRLSDIRFFDSKRRELGPRTSLLMWYLMFLRGVRIKNVDGLCINFVAA